MSRSILLILIAVLLIVASCGKKDDQAAMEITASAGEVDPAVAEADSALQAYLGSQEGVWAFEQLDSVYKPFIKKYPNSTALLRDYQDLYRRFERRDDAITLFETRFQRDSKSPMNAYLYGRIIEDNIKGRELFKTATELDPNYYWGWHGLGVNCLMEDPVDTAIAIEALKNAIRADNSQSVPFDMLGDIYQARGNNETALKYYDLLSQTSPEEFRALGPKIDLLHKMNQMDEAGAEIQAFLDKNPNSYYGVEAMVEHLEEQDKYAEALPYLHKMTTLASNPTNAYYELMIVHTKLDQPDSAIAVLNKAIEAGFDDFRPVLHDPNLSGMREHPDFGDVRSDIIKRMEMIEDMRKEMLAEDREERKTEAMKEKLDEPAPDFTLVDLYGNTVTLSELKGKPVILDFWATWCGPCRMTMPLMQEFYNSHKDDIHYFAVNVWERDTTEVRPFLAKYGYEFNNLFGSAENAQDFGVTGIPTLFLVDEESIIRYKHIGYRQDADEVLSWQLDDVLTD